MSGMIKLIITDKLSGPPDWPTGWRDEIKADLTAQLEAGGTLYGIRSLDGAYVARSKNGDRVIKLADEESI